MVEGDRIDVRSVEVANVQLATSKIGHLNLVILGWVNDSECLLLGWLEQVEELDMFFIFLHLEVNLVDDTTVTLIIISEAKLIENSFEVLEMILLSSLENVKAQILIKGLLLMED